MDMTTIWNDEMNRVLGVFEKETTISLRVIRNALRDNSLSLPAEFEQYFMNASNARILDTYNRFKIASLLEDRVNGCAELDLVNPCQRVDLVNSVSGVGSSASHIKSHHMNEHPVLNNRTVQLNDSSVGTIPGRSGIKAEPTQRTSCETSNKECSEIIQIDDSNDEERPKTFAQGIKGALAVEAGANEALFRKHSTNPSVQSNGSEVCVNNIKPKLESMDYDMPLVLIAVPRELNASNGSMSRSGLNGICEPENGIVNEKSTSNGHQTWKSNTCAIDRSSTQATRKTGKTNEGLARKSPSNKKLKRYKCQHCDYAAALIGNLKRHIRTHTGEKPYRCDRCFKRFPASCSLKRHIKVHANEFPFNCSLCFRGFLLENDKNSHEMACKARRYDCYLCKKTIAGNKCDLEKHMRTHTGIKPFRCAMCMKKFTRKSNLKEHLNNIHT